MVTMLGVWEDGLKRPLWHLGETGEEWYVTSIQPPVRGRDRGERVLVVEDEEVMLRSFVTALEFAGFEVLTARCGREALDIAFREHPEVVLLDRYLPDVSGQEVLDRLRAHPGAEDAAILLISGDDALERKVEGFGRGANDYLTKPIDVRELIARVEAQAGARNRWMGRLGEAMSARLSLARHLVELDASQPLPHLVGELEQILFHEAGAKAVALSPLVGEGVAAPIDQPGARYRPEIAVQAARSIEAPWVEHSPGESVIHVPLQSSATTFAVLSVAADEGKANRLLSTLVDLSAQLSGLLRPGIDAAASSALDREAVERLMTTDGMWPVFQPIVSLRTGGVVGFEGLTRFADGTRPDLAFALAGRVQLRSRLELEAARRIVEAAAALPSDAWLSLNVSVETLLSVDLEPVIASSPRELLLEITEHELVTDYREVIEAVERLGVGLSVDDAGSGYASLRHVYELQPTMVKLDRGWVAGLDGDGVRQALIDGLLRFTAASGASLVAEGIERPEERDVLTDLEVPLAQGFLFGKPGPAATWCEAGG